MRSLNSYDHSRKKTGWVFSMPSCETKRNGYTSFSASWVSEKSSEFQGGFIVFTPPPLHPSCHQKGRTFGDRLTALGLAKIQASRRGKGGSGTNGAMKETLGCLGYINKPLWGTIYNWVYKELFGNITTILPMILCGTTSTVHSPPPHLNNATQLPISSFSS